MTLLVTPQLEHEFGSGFVGKTRSNAAERGGLPAGSNLTLLVNLVTKSIGREGVDSRIDLAVT